MLHWINAFEEGDEVVLDGFFQHTPPPSLRGAGTFYERMSRFLALDQMQSRAHRWRFNLATGETREEDLSDRIMEFGMINGRYGGRPYRYAYNMTAPPGRFLFDGVVKQDLMTGGEEHYAFGDGIFASEMPMAPRVGSHQRGRRLPAQLHHRHERRPLRVLDLRGAGYQGRPDRPRRPARPHQQRHTRVLGAGGCAARVSR